MRVTGRWLAAIGLTLGLSVAVWTVGPAAAQGTAVDVGLGDFVFLPAELAVPAGAVTFNLNNVDSRRHSMTIAYNGTELASETLASGSSAVWEVVLDQPGVYEFWCGVGNHRERGMVGQLTVE